MNSLIRSKLPRRLLAEINKIDYFGREANAQLIREGLANIAYKVEVRNKFYLLKFAIAPASKPTVFIQANYENRLAEKIEGLDISPKFHSYGKVKISGRKFPYSIQEFVDGGDVDYEKDLRIVANLLANLHKRTRGKKAICSYRVLDVPSYLERNALITMKSTGDKPLEKALKKFTQAAIEELENTESPKEGYYSLIHNDLTQENILISKRRGYLIDWGWAMYSSPALDLCNFLSPFTTSWVSPIFLKRAQVREFLNSYCKHFPKRDAEFINSSLRDYWLAYNSLLINWIYYEFLKSHQLKEKSHFSNIEFVNSAILHAKTMQKAFANQTAYK